MADKSSTLPPTIQSPVAPSDDTLLDVRGVARVLGVTRATVFRYLKRGSIPEPRRYSERCLRWSLADLLDHIPDQEQGDGAGR